MTQSTMAGLSADKRRLLALLLDDDDDAPGSGRTVNPRADGDAFPLSLMQRRLWLTEQLEPGTALYNIPLALRLSGALDAAALERAFREVARRHQVLRATFAPGADDAPVQRILPALPAAAFRVEDLSALNGHREGAVRARAEAEAALPFSLSEGPLFRAVLLRLAAEEHVLLLTLHHIVGDGWSNGILFRELFALYGAWARGEATPLPELEIQYADFAAWQQERLSGAFLDAELAWWRERLAGAPALLELPTDRPRPAAPSRAGAQCSLRVPREVLDAAHALSRGSGATLYMTLLAALQLVLGRWSGQDDVLVGSPVAGREHAELEPLIGCFINTVVMRGDLRGDPTFGELLARTREAALGAYAHQEVPFERLVDDLAPARTLAYAPLFQVMLTLQNAPASVSTGRTGLTFAAVEREGSASKFDLTLYATERPDGLLLSAVYATDLFDGSTVDRLLAQVAEVLRQAAAEPGRLISAISLADDEERDRVVVEWNRTDADLGHEALLHRMIEAQAARTPDALAVVFEDERLTYAELDARANRLAQLLHHRGIGPEVRVGVCMERSAELVVAILAVLKAGGAYVPLDPGYPAERLAHMLADSGVPVLLTVDAVRARLPEHAAETLCLDSDAALIAAESAVAPECAAEPEHAAYVIYTSGSTGLPKGVVIEHRNIANYVAGVLTRMAATPCASYALVSTVAADLGHTVLFPALCTGAALHVVSESRATNPEAFADYMERHGVEGMKIVPSHLQALQSGSRPAAVLPKKLLVLGGDGARREWIGKVREMAPEMAILNHYGPTETTVGVLTNPIIGTPERAILPLGKPLPNSRVYVLDARMRVLPVGVPGELYIGGAQVARGYLNRPELTAERFVDSPFVAGDRLYRTGDRVRWLADGTIEFLGRVDDQVKIRGFRVELGEIEAALRQHPRVSAVAVVAREDVPGEKRLAGYVVADGRAPTVAELRAFLLERLPDYMVPAAWAVLDALPLNRNGKVDRHALPAPDAHAAAAHPSAPRTALETALAEVWAEVLRVGKVGLHDNFFELGGDSIQAIKVISRLRKREVKLTSRQLFEHQTIAKLSALLDSAPRTPVERTLAEVWSEVLRVERVGVNDNFFELGGDSIQAIKVISRLRKREVKLTSRQLFDHQTIAALAAVLDRAPANPAEQVLAEVWAEVLRVESVGVDDNFFELGGDSILAIKVISRLRKRGIRLTSRQLFEHRTVRTLAAVAAAEPGAEAAVGAAVSAAAPLTPIQRSFFERGLPNPSHYNQSMLLRVRDRLDAGAVEGALAALLAHHDALRLRFRPAADGSWTQETGGAAAKAPFDTVDLSALPHAARAAAVEAVCAERQASLDIAAGALMRAVLFECGADEPQRLFVCIHHLAVDGVSWRILLEDLETAVGQLQAGRPVALGEKTTSFTRWAARLAEHAASGALNAEAAYWTDAARAVALPLPAEGDRAGGAPRTVAVELTEDETRALLQEVPAAYRTQINDVLLAAVARALAGWTGADAVRLAMEGHGREELFGGVDLSRTVGWFTSLFPVHLAVPAEDEGPAALLRSVKEQLRAIPGKGVDFGILRWLAADAELRARLAAVPRPEVVFNYLGQMDGTVGDDALFASTGGRRGPEQGADAPRAHALEINGAVRGGRLVLAWQFAQGRFAAETVRRVAGACMDALRGLIAHCTEDEAGGCTPSDFPLARLSQAQLDRAVGRGRGVEDVYPLSPLQQGILFHAVAAEAADEKPYVVLSGLTLRGVDPRAMRAAWQQVVDRHPILRTRFAWEGLAEPHQVVERQVELPWVEEDWHALPVEAREHELDRYLKDELERGFDPSAAPLMRCALFRVEDDVYELVRTHHHLVSDGWSTPLLLRDMVQAYRAGLAGGRAELRAPRPYADYVAWLGAQDQAKAEAYWRRTLDGFTAPTSLGVDRGTQAAAGAASNQDVQLRLSAELTQQLGALVRTRQITMNTLVQGAWALLLSRYAGEDDVVFGSVLSGRPADLPGVEEMVGMFINTLPVRVRVPQAVPVAEWLSALQAEQAEAREFEYTPLMRAQEWSQVPRGTPLFDSLLVFENYPLDALRGGGTGPRVLDVVRARSVERTSAPLTVVAAPGTELLLKVEYDPRRIDTGAATRMVGHLRQVLHAFATAPDAPVSAVPLLTEGEYARVAGEWNATEAPVPAGAAHEWIAAQAARTPHAVAVECGGERLTYAELERRAGRLAAHLRARGVGPETRVALFLERAPEAVVAVLGVWKAGAAYVPVDPAYPAERVAWMLDDCGAPIVLTQARVADRLPAGLPALRLDADWTQVEAAGDAPAVRTDPDALAYVIYTSGSTGRPKGVGVVHGGLSNYLAWAAREYAGAEGRGAPVHSSLSFDLTVTSLFVPLLSGKTVTLVPEAQGVEGLGEALRNGDDFTLVKITPGHLELLARQLEPAQMAGRVRTFVVGGEQLLAETVAPWHRHAPETVIVNEYGPTETVVGCCVFRSTPGTAPDTGALAIGHPIANTALYVLDRHLHPLPAGVPGELYVGGAGVARGYLGRPGLTAGRFVPDPFGGVGARLYRTGDLARRRPDGTLEFLGRVDDQVKVRGFRIELGEVEAALAALPGVREAAVAVRDDAPGGRGLVGYVVLTDDAPAPAEVREALRARLPEHMVPAAVVRMDALPLTRNGKVDRRALPSPGFAERAVADAWAPPRSAMERAVAAVWAEALGVEAVGVNDNFFDLGGNSMALLRVSGALREVAGREVRITELFRHTTVSALAAVLAGGTADEDEVPGRQARAAEIDGGKNRLFRKAQRTPSR
jgi:amino acid adenylation domain-containing protein/non-ribosomal peptide synthase protein (TIGR01720 family)